VGGLALDWMSPYLVGRSQYVKVQGEASATVGVDNGVPQGSVLGPLLFITYKSPVEELIN
jgi:ribonucleases P/MRP protein subunit RPP40